MEGLNVTKKESEIRAEGGVEIPQEQPRPSITYDAADYKRTLDSALKLKTEAVIQIFTLLETKAEDGAVVSEGEGVNNPKEALANIRKTLSGEQNLEIDDILKALVTVRKELLGIQLWVSAENSKIQTLIKKRDALKTREHGLLVEQTVEGEKNFLVKLFRQKKYEKICAESCEVSEQISAVNSLLETTRVIADRVKFTTKELSVQSQELAINAIRRLFQDVAEGYVLLKGKLTTPEVKEELNAVLIKQRILPELEKIKAKGKITKEEADEYLSLLKLQLAEGTQVLDDNSAGKEDIFAARRQRMAELNGISRLSLEDIKWHVSCGDSEVADSYYDNIFDILLREAEKAHIEYLRDILINSLDQGQQAKIVEISEKVISSQPSHIYKRGRGLDLSKLPIDDFKNLNGLERWQIVKNFSEGSGVISSEVFKHVETVIIQRLYNELLAPGGAESWDGTSASSKMGKLGNPEALPLMLHHIETFGSGHTSNDIVYSMERLLEESDPADLKRVLESIPKDKRAILDCLNDKRSYMTRFGHDHLRYAVAHLIKNGGITLVKEQMTRILERDGNKSEEELKSFYFGDDNDTPENIELFLRAREEVERVIIDSKLNIWSQSADKLLSALINPRHGESTMFPRRIIREGLGIEDEKILNILNDIFETKTFKRSGFDREAFLDGLLLLNSKENGKVVLEKLFVAYRGAKDDPARMRRVLQSLSTLDGFGEYNFTTPDQDKIDEISREIALLQSQYSQMKDKAGKKELKSRIDALNIDLQNLTGLKGIEEVMTQKVVEAACRRLGLSPEYKGKVEENLDELMKSGIFEIVPSLAGKYEGKNEVEVKNLLKVITEHIINGDFKSWRYSHERSGEQLAGLTKEQKEFWQGTLEPVSIEIEIPEDEKGRRADELMAAQTMVKNAKEHIIASQPKFDFSRERARALVVRSKELVEMIKSSSAADEKKQYAVEKRSVEAEASLINGVLDIEGATTKSFTRQKIIIQARELCEKIAELNLPLAGLDIEQIEKIFTVGDIKSVTASESDDPLTLLKIGVEPQETCQSWRNGGFNECLLAYVADSNKKVVNVADSEGRVIARSVIKLVNQRDENDFESKTQRKTLLVERPYSLLPNSEVYRAFVRLLLIKANGMDASITFSSGYDTSVLKVFIMEATSFGYKMKEGKLDVAVPHSMNKYEYSDTLGGKISWFDRYHQLDAVTFEKK